MSHLKIRTAQTSFATATVTAILITFSVISAVEQSQAMAQGSDWGPTWTADGKLKLPEGYHEWVFLGSPLTPNALNGGQAGFPEYHNVYVHPRAFSVYRRTGEWPEGTILLKELQLLRNGTSADGSSVEASGRGYFPGARNGIDISVKDSDRFADTNGWGFFNFGHHAPPYLAEASEAPVDACAGCHIANADNMVFSKFYKPILDAR
jgi:hypothetical protein